MRQYIVEILRISSFLTVFFYRRFFPLDVGCYAFGAENDASSSGSAYPLVQTEGAVSNFAFETAPIRLVSVRQYQPTVFYASQL